ncbi:MAG: YIP1 family protein [Thermodesulfobacteriota bacterium]
MQMVCPYCHFTKEVDPGIIPPGAKTATCPNCGRKFQLGPGPAAGPESVEGRLRTEDRPEPPPPPPPGIATGPALSGSVPWEERSGSLFGDLWATWKMALFNPMEFFDRLAANPGRPGALSYGVILWSAGMILSLLLPALLLGISSRLGEGSGYLFPRLSVLILGLTALFSPLLALMAIYVGAAVVHLFLMVAGASGGGFGATLRVMCYCLSPQVFNVVPYLGSVASGLWGLVLAIIGLPKVHQAGTARVVIAVLVIPLILLVGLAVLGILAAIMIPLVLRGRG